tara:strand:- start:702 stop:926 length:225 start_codon:yes stop_codon:yes gene_type:complete
MMYDSTYHPEDDLPSWVFITIECDFCGNIEDEGYDYEEYDIAICKCVDCPNEECNGLINPEGDEFCAICGEELE